MKFQWTSALIGAFVAGGGVFVIGGILWARDHNELAGQLGICESTGDVAKMRCMAAKVGVNIDCVTGKITQ